MAEDEDQVKLETFLRSRGISEDTIQYMKDEKIEPNILLLMDDVKLESLFPKYGDRVAIIDFYKRNFSEVSKRKQGLLDKLRKKLKAKHLDGKQTHAFKTSERANRNAQKPTMSIELGWLHYENAKYVQVRTKFGGGARKVSCSKRDTKEVLLQRAKDMFFPEGRSTKGRINNFEHKIFDFKQNELHEDMAVSKIQELSGIQKLRFYLATRRKPAETVLSGNSDTTDSTITIQSCNDTNEENFSVNILSTADEGTSNNGSTIFVEETQSLVSEPTNYFVESESISLNQHLPSDISTDYQYFPPVLNNYESFTLTLMLHRGQVFDELISAFLNETDYCRPLSIEMVVPNGQTEQAVDAGGVLRDALSEFWETFYSKCTVGTRAKVPCLRHDFDAEKWKAVARIRYRGWMDEHYLPIKLARPFLEYCFTGYSQSDLVPTLLEYVSIADAQTLADALNDFTSVDLEIVCEILNTLDCKWTPTPDNLNKLLQDIAHKEIIQQPMFVIECFKEILLGCIDASSLSDVYEKMKPTARNILKLLVVEKEEINPDEYKVFGYLKKFIRESEEMYLKNLLRFCTGADVITIKEIKVTFNSSEGLYRTPVAHTCGAVIEISKKYDNFPEFRTDFNGVLSSNIWIMDIV